MSRVMFCCLALCSVSAIAKGQDVSLARVVIPDDEQAASPALEKWLTARGLECQVVSKVIVYKHQRVLTNLLPITADGELDRLHVAAFYSPKDEYRGKPELEQLATKLNKKQNMLRVFVDDDGDLGIASSITYLDELTAKEFDAFMDLFARVVKQFILTEESLVFLK